MLDVNIEKILPITAVRDALNKIIDEVEGSDELYVITKNGKPSAIIVGVHHLEKLTGIDHKEIMPEEPSEIGSAAASTESTVAAASGNDQTDDDKTSTDALSQPPTNTDNSDQPSQITEQAKPQEAALQTQVQTTVPGTNNDFDDLFSTPEPTPLEPAAMTPQIPSASEPTTAEPATTAPPQTQTIAESPAIQPVMPQIQPQSQSEGPTIQQTAAVPPAENALDNSGQAGNNVPINNQTNIAQ